MNEDSGGSNSVATGLVLAVMAFLAFVPFRFFVPQFESSGVELPFLTQMLASQLFLSCGIAAVLVLAASRLHWGAALLLLLVWGALVYVSIKIPLEAMHQEFV